MESTKELMEPLLEKFEQYGKTNFELVKLRTIDKAASLTASVITNSIRYIVFSFFIGMASVGAAFYIGKYLGDDYLGFFIIAGFYAVLWILLVLVRNAIKNKINDSIIKRILE